MSDAVGRDCRPFLALFGKAAGRRVTGLAVLDPESAACAVALSTENFRASPLR